MGNLAYIQARERFTQLAVEIAEAHRGNPSMGLVTVHSRLGRRWYQRTTVSTGRGLRFAGNRWLLISDRDVTIGISIWGGKGEYTGTVREYSLESFLTIESLGIVDTQAQLLLEVCIKGLEELIPEPSS